MTKVHHTVAKKAAKLRIELLPQEDGTFRAVHADLPSPVAGKTASDALNEAAKALGYKPSKPKKSKKDKPAKVIIVNKSVVRQPYKDYYKSKGSGQGNGDRLDVALRDALEGDENCLPRVAKENNVPWVWNVLNRGLQRMNLTNVLRARVKRGEKISVLGKTIASL